MALATGPSDPKEAEGDLGPSRDPSESRQQVPSGASRTPTCCAQRLALEATRSLALSNSKERPWGLRFPPLVWNGAAQSWAASGGHQKGSARRCPSLEPGRAPGTPGQETFPAESRTSHATGLGVGKRWLFTSRCTKQGRGLKAALERGGGRDGEVAGQASRWKVSFDDGHSLHCATSPLKQTEARDV